MSRDTSKHSEEGARFYHGTRTMREPGTTIEPTGDALYLEPAGDALYFDTEMDAAIWAAELCVGDGEPRVYEIRPCGPIERASDEPGYAPPPHPALALRSRAPLEVLREVTTFPLYHGTRAALRPGDLIEPGHSANFGPGPRSANYVYFTRTLDASIWGAELASGTGRERIYLVEPTGPVEDDPNLTNTRFRGNPTKSFRSLAPLRVLGEVAKWQGHRPEVVQAMKASLARLNEAGVAPNDG